MEIVKEFGLNPVLLIAQVINFLIILFILKKFLYKPVLETIRKREEKVKEGIAEGEKGREMLGKAIAEEKELLQKATERAQRILDEARQETSEMIALAQNEGKKRAEKILEETHKKIEQEIEEAKRDLTKNIGQVSVEILEKALQGLVDSREQKQFIERALKNIRVN